MQADVDKPWAFRQREARLNGHHWQFVDEGSGPLLILLHGFPYSWYVWRKVIPDLAAAGYRVVAPDLLGYGGSDAPDGLAPYTQVRGAGDLVGLLRTLGEPSAVLIGHDVGASLGFAAAQMRPELFPALVLLNTPPVLRAPVPPSEAWRDLHAQTAGMFYQACFAGEEVIAELDADVRHTLRSILFSVSGDARGAQRWRPFLAPGERFLDTVFDPPRMPAWLSAAALDAYVAAYEPRGFRGPLASYRCRELNWQLGAFLDGFRPAQPSLFVGGACDPAGERLRPAYDALERTLPGLRQKSLLRGAGHCLPEEAPVALTALLLPFLAAVTPRASMACA
jgi:pimeloyl-ACP methyl ester carboxylesterase